MEGVGLVALLLCLVIAAAVSKRVQGTIITLPMVYTVLGLLVGSAGLDLVKLSLDSEILHIVAELTLVMVLATDASRINVRQLVRDHILPLRLLGIGLPLTMVVGTVVAFIMFREMGLWGAAILAIILSPTDASLGQPVVDNPRVPVRIRQALNIESGLNDGIAMPFLLLAIAIAIASEEFQGVADWVGFTVLQIAGGVVVGVIMGYLTVRFIEWGDRSGWMSVRFEKLATLALVLLAYLGAELTVGNGFIAAFCMGVTAGNIPRRPRRQVDMVVEHAEIEVQGLILLTFVLYGAVMLPLGLDGISIPILVYSLISLTLVRMVPVAIALYRSRVRPATTLFLGWFGPRGTASILYIFTVLEAEELIGVNLIYDVVMITVLLSVFAHGITAAPLAKRYGQYMDAVDAKRPGTAEMEEVSEMPLRPYPGMPA